MTDLRRIDALVAEHVMGWPRYGGTGWPIVPSFDDRFRRVELIFGTTDDSFKQRQWHPSEDIAAAWEVVEELAHYEFRLSNPCHWVAQIRWNTEECDDFVCEVSAPTAPLAICLAALKAKGVEIPE